jgi:hypothetical protein
MTSIFKALVVDMFYITKMEKRFGFPKKLCVMFPLSNVNRSFLRGSDVLELPGAGILCRAYY